MNELREYLQYLQNDHTERMKKFDKEISKQEVYINDKLDSL